MRGSSILKDASELMQGQCTQPAHLLADCAIAQHLQMDTSSSRGQTTSPSSVDKGVR